MEGALGFLGWSVPLDARQTWAGIERLGGYVPGTLLHQGVG
jgi:hypothetical protein